MLRGSFNAVSLLVLTTSAIGAAVVGWTTGTGLAAFATVVAGLLAASSPRQIDQWERGLLLRFGRFVRVVQPGITWVIPVVDRLAARIDTRIRSTPFAAEKALTRDTVPVDVDAVLFWVVTDAKRALLEIEEYATSISWAAQATLRDVIGQVELAKMISDRRALDKEIQAIVDAKTCEWGITVQSVEIRDVRIPHDLENAMSRTAQAVREREARILLAQSERAIADQMEEAAKVYAENPTALQLRAMNMARESIKENTALMILPSPLANAMEPLTVGVAAGHLREEHRKSQSERSSE